MNEWMNWTWMNEWIRRRLLVNLNQNSSCRSADSCAYFSSRVCWVCIIFNVIHVKCFQCFSRFRFYINSLAHIFISLFASPKIFNRLDMNEGMNEFSTRLNEWSLAHIFLSLFASPKIFNRLDMNDWIAFTLWEGCSRLYRDRFLQVLNSTK